MEGECALAPVASHWCKARDREPRTAIAGTARRKEISAGGRMAALHQVSGVVSQWIVFVVCVEGGLEQCRER